MPISRLSCIFLASEFRRFHLFSFFFTIYCFLFFWWNIQIRYCCAFLCVEWKKHIEKLYVCAIESPDPSQQIGKLAFNFSFNMRRVFFLCALFFYKCLLSFHSDLVHNRFEFSIHDAIPISHGNIEKRKKQSVTKMITFNFFFSRLLLMLLVLASTGICIYDLSLRDAK